LKRLLLIVLLLTAGVTRAGGRVFDVGGAGSINGLAVAKDGTIWFTQGGGTIGRVLPDGTIEKIDFWPRYQNEYPTVLQPLPNGELLVGSRSGALVRVDASLQIVIPDYPIYAVSIAGLFPATNGDWWVIDPYKSAILRLRADGETIGNRGLGFPIGAVAIDRNGDVYISSVDGIYRGRFDGPFTRMMICENCIADWMEVLGDGTIVMSNGILRPDLTFHPRSVRANDSVVGPDGRVWLAKNDSIQTIDGEGHLEIVAVPPQQQATWIVASDDALWYAEGSTIGRVDPAATVDLSLRPGDLIVCEERQATELNTVLVLTHIRRGVDPFALLFFGEAVTGVPYVTPSRVLVPYWSGTFVKTVDAGGDTVESWHYRLAESPKILALNRDDTMYVIYHEFLTNAQRLAARTADGRVLYDIAVPEPYGLTIHAVDLAADQCTLFYLATNPNSRSQRIVGRMDVCDGRSMSPWFSHPDEAPRDLRLTRDGEIVIAYPSRVVRYGPDRTERAVIRAEANYEFSAVALDPDSRFVWIGSNYDVRRVEWATGAIRERYQYYTVRGLSIVGEPRAARELMNRRRAASH